MQLKSISAIVTGGASGLGAATARELAAAGAKVAIFDMNMAAGENVAAEIGGVACECDVTSAAAAEAAIKKAAVKHGPARVLVNCAGVGVPGKAVGKDGPLPLEAFNKVVQINLIGTFNLIRLCAAAMQKLEPLADNERGVIVNTASVAAFDGQIGQTAYTASKAAVHGITLVAARDLASSQIRVNTIAPGTFDTPMLARLRVDLRDALASAVPHPKRLGSAQDYAHMAVSLLENPYVNGETIRLDGAIRMPPR